MIALSAKPTRVALVAGLLLVLLLLIGLAMVIAHAHLGSTPMMHSQPLIAANGGGGPGTP